MTDLAADYKALAEYRPTHKVRFVTAASLFDGHDAAINIMRRILQNMGAEVIHLGHNRSVDEVVTAALQGNDYTFELPSQLDAAWLEVKVGVAPALPAPAPEVAIPGHHPSDGSSPGPSRERSAGSPWKASRVRPRMVQN